MITANYFFNTTRAWRSLPWINATDKGCSQAKVNCSKLLQRRLWMDHSADIAKQLLQLRCSICLLAFVYSTTIFSGAHVQSFPPVNYLVAFWILEFTMRVHSRRHLHNVNKASTPLFEQSNVAPTHAHIVGGGECRQNGFARCMVVRHNTKTRLICVFIFEKSTSEKHPARTVLFL